MTEERCDGPLTVSGRGGAAGLVYLSTPAMTVGLVVDGGVVVDAPPIARRWTLGRDAREVWREAARRRARLVWLPAGPGRRGAGR